MADELDENLLWRFVQGDRDAFQSLFRQFEGDVYQWVLRIVRDPSLAEDVVVDAFWRAYRGRARFDWSRSFGAWTRRIATNASSDHLQTIRRRAETSMAHEVQAAPPVPEGLAESLALAFRRLPPKFQIVAALALVEERSYAEIGEALQLPVGTVKSRVFRAVRALRQELNRLGIRP